MRAPAIGFVIVLHALGACEKKPSYSPQLEGFAEMVTRFEGIVKKMCACGDAACASTAREEMNAWVADRLRGTSTRRPPSKEESQRLQDGATHYTECMQRLLPAGSAR